MSYDSLMVVLYNIFRGNIVKLAKILSQVPQLPPMVDGRKGIGDSHSALGQPRGQG